MRILSKCITISPGGYLGMYMLGSLVYMKNNFDTRQYYVGGASAGSLLSLYMLSKQSDAQILSKVIMPFVEDLDDIQWTTVLDNLKFYLKQMSPHIDNKRLFISATEIQTSYPWIKQKLRNSFVDETDMINFIICSCFVPVLCGPPDLTTKYIDGAFTDSNPIPKNVDQIMYVSPEMWGREFTIYDCVHVDKSKAIGLLLTGYMDARKNHNNIPLKKLPRWRRTFNSFYHMKTFLNLRY